MSRKKVPPHLLHIRGSIGKAFVIKHYSWGVIKTKFPNMSGIIASAKQRKCRNVFKEAVLYAQAVIADPVKKKEWQSRIRRRNGVYNKAIKAFMLKARCDQDREKLLIEQSMRLAYKNELLVKPVYMEMPTRTVSFNEEKALDHLKDTG